MNISGIAHGETGKLPPPTVEELLDDPTFWSPKLSPSGKYLAGVRGVEDNSLLMIVDLDDEDSVPDYYPVGDLFVNWVEWISDDRVLVSVTGFVNLRTGKQMTREALKDIADTQYPAPFTRILSMKRDASDAVILFDNNRLMNRNFGLGRVVSLLHDDPDHILMAAWQDWDLDLFRVNILDGSSEVVARGMSATYRWYADKNGEPAIRYNSNSRGTVIYVYARSGIENGKYNWRKVRTVRLKRDDPDDLVTEFRLLEPGPTASTYYVIARPENEDKIGVYLYDFEQNAYVETVYKNDKFDVSGALFDRNTSELAVAHFHSHRFEAAFADPVYQRHFEALQTYFGNRLNIHLIMSTDDGSRWLIRVDGPTDPGSYYIYFLEDASFRYLGGSATSLQNKAFGEAEVISYTARDGLALTGYLTRPTELAPDAKPPLIMLPHGGPESRDRMRFNARVQILVAAGYQVFQPNFRGSEGYGIAFADMGRREWGRKMQTDLEDGFAHLVELGLAEKDRACIMGGSYGGYAALAAATLTPDLYRCVIATAAPTDLSAFLRWVRREDGRDSEAYEYWVEHIGHPKNDKAMIEAVSPALLADRITKPILLIHGKEDRVVPVKQTTIMEKALKKANKPYTKLILEDAGHYYGSRSDEEALEEQEAILEFLAEHLPVN